MCPTMTVSLSGTTVWWVQSRAAAPKEVYIQAAAVNSDDADVTCCGTVFQTRAAATGKARSLIADNRVRRTISDDEEAERRRPRRASKSAGCSSARYDSAAPC